RRALMPGADQQFGAFFDAPALQVVGKLLAALEQGPEVACADAKGRSNALGVQLRVVQVLLHVFADTVEQALRVFAARAGAALPGEGLAEILEEILANGGGEVLQLAVLQVLP